MLLPGMRAGLGLNYDQIGFISTGNFAGYLIAVIAAPALIRRFQPRITIVGGLLLIALCMLGISRSGSFEAVPRISKNLAFCRIWRIQNYAIG